MNIKKIPFSTISYLSKRDQVYNNGTDKLAAFVKYPVDIDAFEQVINDRKKQSTNRTVLVDTLLDQYTKLDDKELVTKNIEALRDENTFTIITAHQPSLFTGPLYFIYKIISTINLTRQLNERYPAYQFVPVFVSGGEDHDFEEINHLHLFGNRIEWNNDESGAVGQMDTSTLGPALEAIKSILGDSPNAQHIYEILASAHTKHTTYVDAVHEMVHRLFGQYGLVFFNMNDARLKQLFAPIIKKELVHQASAELVNTTAEALVDIGFKQQATPRDINLFYLKGHLRNRIEKQGDHYVVIDTELQFSEAEMMTELEQHPERFSPNVVMRPLYQELILPNLAYIGGGGELAYWMERKNQFEHFGLNFPMLIRRNSVLWIDKGNVKRLKKLDLEVAAIFEDSDQIVRAFIEANAKTELNFDEQNSAFAKVFDELAEMAQQIDPTLKKAILGEQTRQVKNLEQLESRLVRAEKQRLDTSVKQIESLKEKLFPGNGLQERHDNFLAFYIKYGNQFFETLLDALNPLDRGQFVVVVDEN